MLPRSSVPAVSLALVAGGVAVLVARRLGYIGVLAADRTKQRVKAKLVEHVRTTRVKLPSGKVSSECHALATYKGMPVVLPAVLGREGRILLGDYIHACALLGDVDEDTDPELSPFLERHGPPKALLNCMGGIDRSLQRAYDKAGISAIGLPGALDKEGYPMLDAHFADAQAFLAAQLAAGRTVFVHCHEGKNRSACICVAYLVVAERMPLSAALRHVFDRRPIVLDNNSFVDQLIDLAQAHGRLTTTLENLKSLPALVVDTCVDMLSLLR